eukprot:CAMPEP_0197129182 /NCGR_PEP_ID=MMETSP1390-20130617/16351_1 /TAXON_ID=38833 /ORGANISM="Micromonas sp., Strain CCMP2099" /LENGTH=182 /DNA_ID=CAMNT_0042571583 /DNA_START=258 /DNA_END=803 /DNA_ORIENTATION=-
MASHKPPCPPTAYVQSLPIIKSNGAFFVIFSGSRDPHLYPHTRMVVVSGSIVFARTFLAAFSSASLSNDFDPPSVSTTCPAPRAAHAIPTTPVPEPSSTTRAPRSSKPPQSSSPAAMSTRKSHNTRDDDQIFPPVPYPLLQPGDSMSIRLRSSAPDAGTDAALAATRRTFARGEEHTWRRTG